jgi:hypothetical protein
MGKVYVTVDGKKKAFDTMEEAEAFKSGLPTEFKKQADISAPKEEELSSNVETKDLGPTEESMSIDDHQHASEENAHVELSDEIKAEIKAEVAVELEAKIK